MSVLFVVLPLSLLIATAGVWAFVWSVRGGQFDDLEGAPMRMLHDAGEFPVGERDEPESRQATVISHPSARGPRSDLPPPRLRARELFGEGPVDL